MPYFSLNAPYLSNFSGVTINNIQQSRKAKDNSNTSIDIDHVTHSSDEDIKIPHMMTRRGDIYNKDKNLKCFLRTRIDDYKLDVGYSSSNLRIRNYDDLGK